MAAYQSNYVTVIHVDAARLHDLVCAFVAQALTQGISVFAAGTVGRGMDGSGAE